MSVIQTIGNKIGLPNHMRIQQLSSDGKGGADKKVYTVLVNPGSYSVTHEACYDKNQEIRGTGTTYAFNKVKPQGMNIELLFDSTGSLGAIPFVGTKNVLEQINDFLDTAFMSYEKQEQPKLLQLIWGPMEFKGVLETIDITYSHFDPTGAPIRAKAACTFSGGYIKFDEPRKKASAEKESQSVEVDSSKDKHAVNALEKHGGYISVVSEQTKETMPKSLRDPEEVAKMIIR